MSIESLTDGKGITCEIDKNTQGRSSMGGVTLTESVRARSVPCWIELLSGSESVIGGQDGLTATHRFYFKNGVTILRTDVIKVTRPTPGATGTTTDTYDDLFINDPNDFGHHFEVRATLRK